MCSLLIYVHAITDVVVNKTISWTVFVDLECMPQYCTY